MLVALLASAKIARRIGELGQLLGFVGGLLIVWAAATFLKGAVGESGRHRERVWTLIGALLISGAFLFELISRVTG